MRFPLFLLATALATAGLAGCVGKDEPQTVTPGTVTDLPDPGEAPSKTPLSVSLSQDLYWISPGTPVTLTAASPEAMGRPLSYRWQYGPPLPAHLRPQEGEAVDEGDDDHGDHSHLLRTGLDPKRTADAEGDAGHAHGDDDAKTQEGGHEHGDGGLDTGDIAPGAYSDLTVDEEGYYWFHCHPHPWMKFNLTVEEGAKPAGIQHVAILDGKTTDAFRYHPAELTVAPGTTLRFHNNGTAVHTTTEEGRTGLLKDIPGNGPEVTFDFPEAGDFRVVVTVTDGASGEGVAETRILVDDNIPSDTYAQVYEDDFDLADPAGLAEQAGLADPSVHAFGIEFPGDLTATLQATSGTPIPPKVNVLVSDAGGAVIGRIEAAADGTIEAPIPAGSYKLTVEPVEGAQIHTTVDLVVKMLLKPPADEPAGGDDPHAHH